MSIVIQINPFDFFVDASGTALDAGYIYIGQPNLDPRQYPAQIYYDEAMTIAAAQPLRTSNGYVYRSGAPTFLYIDGNYSVLVQDKNHVQVYYVADALVIGNGRAVSTGDLANFTDTSLGAGLVGRATRQINNLSELRTVVGRYANDMIYLERHTAGYDRGGGHFVWDASSVVDDDGVTTIEVTGEPTGRWIRLYSYLTASMFGAKAIPVFDNAAAFASIETWLRAKGSNLPEIKFEEGRYEYSASPNWGISHATINPIGTVYLRNTGTGHSVIIDAGATSGAVFGLKMGNERKFIVEGSASSQDGVYGRALCQDTHIGFQINGAGTLFSGMNIEFAVCATIDVVCSNNVQGFTWYSRPANGLTLNRRLAGELCSYCYFPNPQLEGTASAGALLDWAQGNVFVGGTMEGIASTGMKLTANAIKNKVIGTDFEVNTDHDIFCEGRGNEFLGINTENRITFEGGAAVINKVIGGSHSKIILGAATLHNVVTGATYNQNADGSTIQDLSGGKVRLRDNYNQGIGRIENVPPGSPIVIAVGPSPFAFQNLGDNEVDVLVSGNVNGISITRNGITNLSGALGGMFRLTPIDIITITYPAATPTMIEYTR